MTDLKRGPLTGRLIVGQALKGVRCYVVHFNIHIFIFVENNHYTFIIFFSSTSILIFYVLKLCGISVKGNHIPYISLFSDGIGSMKMSSAVSVYVPRVHIAIQTQTLSPTSLKPYYLETQHIPEKLRLQEESNNPSNILAQWNGLVHGLDPKIWAGQC